MEETRFKTDHSQHGKDQKRTGRLRISAPKIILFVLGCRKKKTKSIRKEKRSINYSKFFSPMGFRLFKAGTEFLHIPFQYSSYRGQQRANYLCNIATLSTLKPLGIQRRGVSAIPRRFFCLINHQDKSSHIHTWRRSGSSCAIPKL